MRLFFIFMWVFLSPFLEAMPSNLQINQVQWYKDDVSQKQFVRLTISWQNAWRDARNHDAVWLFFKYQPIQNAQANYRHAKVAKEGQGFATNADWPKGSTETAGFGFRGGGYYENDKQYGDLNPNAVIAQRRFAGWAGGMRSLAYGSRFARTAK
jgi:hypothetical protein